MAAGTVSSACSATTMDIVCGTLQTKLITTDLSSDSSHCIQFGSSLLSPCEFQCQTGKSSSRNWKNSIRYMDKAISNAFKSYVMSDGKRCCCLLESHSRGVVVMATLYLTLNFLAGHLIYWIVIIILTLNLWISQDSPN